MKRAVHHVHMMSKLPWQRRFKVSLLQMCTDLLSEYHEKSISELTERATRLTTGQSSSYTSAT